MLRQHIKQAFRQNLKPGIALQTIAILLVLCYYYVPDSSAVFGVFAALKSEYGIRYTIVSTAISGGLLPFLYLLLSGQIRHHRIAQLGFYLIVWAFMGFTVEYLYYYQGLWFGLNNDAMTLTKKVLFDQFVYTAFFAAPFLALIFLWKEQDFSFRRWQQALSRHTFTVQIPANLISNWFVWIPACAAVYAMPQPLQVPLFNIVVCFWVLMLAVLNQGDQSSKGEDNPTP